MPLAFRRPRERIADLAQIGALGDYNGTGTTDIAIYRPSTGIWYVRNQFSVLWGVAGDIPAYRPQYLLQWP